MNTPTEGIDVLAWFDALIERNGLPDDGDTAKARAAVAELIGSAQSTLAVIQSGNRPSGNALFSALKRVGGDA
jgi:hypothetical protein